MTLRFPAGFKISIDYSKPIIYTPPTADSIKRYLDKIEKRDGVAGRKLAQHFDPEIGPRLAPEEVKVLQQTVRLQRRLRSAKGRLKSRNIFLPQRISGVD